MSSWSPASAGADLTVVAVAIDEVICKFLNNLDGTASLLEVLAVYEQLDNLSAYDIYRSAWYRELRMKVVEDTDTYTTCKHLSLLSYMQCILITI